MPVTKEEILLAIKREAAVNGGQPLGMPRFESATGIKPHDWRGRYWTKWNDALAEAGFAPNVWNAAVRSEGDLLLMLADLTRSLGHFPTRDEQDFHHRQDPRFPFNRNLVARLGTKASQVSRLLDFTHSHDGFEDVAAIVQPLATAKRATPRRSLWAWRGPSI